MRRSATLTAVAFALTFIAASCASDTMAPRAARDLAGMYTPLVAAAEEGDRAAAERALADLVAAVERWESADALPAGRADEILAAADAVLADLADMPRPTPSSTLGPSPTAEEGDGEEEEEGEEGDEDGHPSEGTPGQDKGKKKGHDDKD